MAQLMPVPLTVSCFSKIQICFTFLVPAHPGSPRKGSLNGCVCARARVCVCARARACVIMLFLNIGDIYLFLFRKMKAYNFFSVRNWLASFLQEWNQSLCWNCCILSAITKYCGWRGSRVVSVLDSGAEGPGFKSQLLRCRVTVLGKLSTPIVPLFTKQQNW